MSKNKREHRVYFTPTALALVALLPRDSGWLFAGRGVADGRPLSDMKKAAARVRDVVSAAKGWPTFDFVGRDLRRTASTLMAEAGVPENDISRVLSHRIPGAPSVTKVYNRYAYDREKRAALETWEARLLAILGDAGIEVAA